MMSRLILILLGMAGIFGGFANPFGAVPFAVLLYPFSIYMLAHKSRHYLRDCLIMGIFGYGAAFYWLAVTAHVYGLVPYAAAIFFPLLLGLYFSLYGTFVAFYLHKARADFAPYKILSAGILWYLAELFRGWFLTGFPWFPLSSAFAPLPGMIQFANIVGTYALSGIFAMAGFFFAELMLLSRKQSGACSRSMRFVLQYGGIFILVAVYYYGSVTLQNASGREQLSVRTRIMHKELDIPYLAAHEMPVIVGQALHRAAEKTSADDVYVTVVQGNISQNVKWSPLFQEDSLKKFFRLSGEALQTAGEAEIFIYPETAFPVTSHHYPSLYEKILAFGSDKTMLFGIPYFAEEDGSEGRYYNTVELVRNGKSIGRYAKEHLVPFGEYVPPLPLPKFFNDMLAMYGGAYSIGENKEQILEVGLKDKTVSFLPLICYEAIFPELTWKKVRENTVHALLNVSNDAWYDKSSAPVQHLYLALMRCVESGLPMIRASNTGISAFIDKYGQIILQTGLFTDETFTVPLFVQKYEPTVFVQLAPYLPYFGMALFVLLQMMTVLRRKVDGIRDTAKKQADR